MYTTLVGLSDAANLLFQSALAFDNSTKITNKILNYNLASWGFRDYFEISARISNLVADGIGIKANWDRVNIQNKVSLLEDLALELEKSGKDTSEIQECIKKAQESFKSSSQSFIYASAAGTISDIVAKTCSGRPVLQVLQDPEVSYRLGLTISESARISENTFLKYSGEITTLIPNLNVVLARGIVSTFVSVARSLNLVPPPLNLNYRMLPDQYSNNPIFSNYVCPITLQIIRYPVMIRDGNNSVHYYELAALHQWVSQSGTNPLTRTPLQTDDIVIDNNTLINIENEMRRLNIPLN